MPAGGGGGEGEDKEGGAVQEPLDASEGGLGLRLDLTGGMAEGATDDTSDATAAVLGLLEVSAPLVPAAAEVEEALGEAGMSLLEDLGGIEEKQRAAGRRRRMSTTDKRKRSMNFKEKLMEEAGFHGCGVEGVRGKQCTRAKSEARRLQRVMNLLGWVITF